MGKRNFEENSTKHKLKKLESCLFDLKNAHILFKLFEMNEKLI